MAVDPRQVLSAFLTISMFAMLSNMVRRDYFDSYEASFQGVSGVQIGIIKVQDNGDESSIPSGQWNERENRLKPCWTKPAHLVEDSKGYVILSLTGGPGNHELQIANAVVVSRFLGAVLVLPEIRGKELGQRRKFGDLYDVGKFTSSLEGVVEVALEPPAQVAVPPVVVRIPSGVSEDYIISHVEPVFGKNGHIRLATFFSRSMPESTPGEELGSVGCLATYEAIALTKGNQEVVDSMVERLRALSDKAAGRFVAVDLRLDALLSTACKGFDPEGSKCYGPEEVVSILTKAGFDGDTTVYLTQTRWHERLDSLKRVFPRTFTKDDLIDPENKQRIFYRGDDLGRALDLQICSESDAFLPAISDLPFSGHVAQKRIVAGRTRFLPLDVADFGGHVGQQCYC